jgi:hypothetical protein
MMTGSFLGAAIPTLSTADRTSFTPTVSSWDALSSPNNMVTHRVVAFIFSYLFLCGHQRRRRNIPHSKNHGMDLRLALADNLKDGDGDTGDTSCT